MGVVGHLRVDPLVDALHEPVRHHALLRPAAARRPRAPEPAALRPEHNIYTLLTKIFVPPAAEVSGGAVRQAALVLGVTLVLTAAASLEVLLLMPSI